MEEAERTNLQFLPRLKSLIGPCVGKPEMICDTLRAGCGCFRHTSWLKLWWRKFLAEVLGHFSCLGIALR